MAWIVAGMAGGAALGMLQGQQQRKAQERANRQQTEIAAAQNQFSPWTGIKPSTPQLGAVTASGAGGALQGGLAGAMFGQQFGSKKPILNAAEANPNPTDKVGFYSAARNPFATPMKD